MCNCLCDGVIVEECREHVKRAEAYALKIRSEPIFKTPEIEATSVEHQGRFVAQYRQAANMSQLDLAKVLGVDLETVQIMEEQRVIENIDMDRRKLLAGLPGVPISLIGLSSESAYIRKISLFINSDYIVFLENELETRWEIYYTGGTLRAARSLNNWMNEVASITKSTQGTIWHKRALYILAMSYQLQGMIARDMMKYDQAHLAYRLAFRIAQELDNPELMASVLARTGVTFIQQNQPIKAITSLRSALGIISDLSLPTLQGHILQALSEAYAKAQQVQDCWQSIGLAESICERYNLVRGRTQNLFSAASATAQKGVDAVLLQDHRAAITLIDKSLVTYDPTLIRGRARLMAQKAEAYYGVGEIDASVASAEEAWKLACSVGVSKTIMSVRKLHTTFIQSSWRKESSVVHLGALLSSNNV